MTEEDKFNKHKFLVTVEGTVRQTKTLEVTIPVVQTDDVLKDASTVRTQAVNKALSTIWAEDPSFTVDPTRPFLINKIEEWWSEEQEIIEGFNDALSRTNQEM